VKRPQVVPLEALEEGREAEVEVDLERVGRGGLVGVRTRRLRVRIWMDPAHYDLELGDGGGGGEEADPAGGVAEAVEVADVVDVLGKGDGLWKGWVWCGGGEGALWEKWPVGDEAGSGERWWVVYGGRTGPWWEDSAGKSLGRC
jgi:hypothetical protein